LEKAMERLRQMQKTEEEDRKSEMTSDTNMQAKLGGFWTNRVSQKKSTRICAA
jgi:hypothetical protein